MQTTEGNPESGKLLRFFEAIHKELGWLPSDKIFFFIKVMDKDGSRLSDIQREMHLTQATINRYARSMGKTYKEAKHGVEKDGPDILETRVDHNDAKYLTVHLTSKGRALAQRLLHAMGDSGSP